jgi:hypothetical protein
MPRGQSADQTLREQLKAHSISAGTTEGAQRLCAAKLGAKLHGMTWIEYPPDVPGCIFVAGVREDIQSKLVHFELPLASRVS